MAVSNTLAKKRTEAFQNVQSASYEVGGMKIELTPEIVKQYMVSGSKDNVTVDEVIHAYEAEVSFDEYAGRKKDGSLNAQWSKKPSTMIRKVALVQALREAFPSAFGGMYTAEEKGFAEDVAGEVYVPPVEAAAIEEKAMIQPEVVASAIKEPTSDQGRSQAPEGQQTFF